MSVRAFRPLLRATASLKAASPVSRALVFRPTANFARTFASTPRRFGSGEGELPLMFLFRFQADSKSMEPSLLLLLPRLATRRRPPIPLLLPRNSFKCSRSTEFGPSPTPRAATASPSPESSGTRRKFDRVVRS